MPKDAPDPVSSQWFWDRYWQADRVAACLTNCVTGNYEPSIRSAWEAFFIRRHNGARVLDIGTGNGAVAIIAWETAARDGKRFEIHGVDRADIEPTRHVHASVPALADIRFHARTAVESLPFQNHYFDAISGQYALEYTEMDRSLAEIKRVAKPGAHLRFILHAADARPVRAARTELAEIKHAIETLHILELARELMRATFAFERAERYAATLETQARTAREAYRVAAHALDACYPQSADQPMLAEILGSVRYAWDHRREFTLEYILKGIDAIETEVQAHRARLENMCAVALNATDAERLCQRFRICGFEDTRLRESRSNNDQDLWGWELTSHASSTPRATREDKPPA